MAFGNWNKHIGSLEYNSLVLDGYPDWHINPKSNPKEPYYFRKIFKQGGGVSSKDIAVWIDDNIEGSFYSRDFVESGIPSLNKGEEYTSIFVFQYKPDYLKALDYANKQ